MKKLLKTLVCCILSVMLCVNFAACSLFGSSSDTTYTIQYTDDNGIHTIEVQNGDLYSLESIPERTGYTFLGLYDAETGGTQYVNSSGSSVSAFTDKENIVLYPQYQAKEYTLILDYGEAEISGSRQLTVTYGESLPELPTGLTVSHKTFSGWYTEEDCGGTKVADNYGLIPVVSLFNSDNFEIKSSTTYIYLYAGFTTETYAVTFNYGSDISSETMNVEYGTNVGDIVTTTRNSDGYAVLSWSLSSGGSEYTGTVTESLVLYALEWAPCIDFNSNGGDNLSAIVARAGAVITLPTPTRQSYKFVYWADSEGNVVDLTTMPSESISLTAVWQATITFDENGGTDVEDISVSSGTTITLPTPEKDGYIFAGWYTSDKTQYTTTKMPSISVELKAGWYEELTRTVVVLESSESDSASTMGSPKTTNLCYTLNYSKYFSDNATHTIRVEGHVQIRSGSTSTGTGYLNFYSQKTISDTYLLTKSSFSSVVNSYKTYTFSASFSLSDNVYMCFWVSPGAALFVKDFYYTVYYPDTSTLYL